MTTRQLNEFAPLSPDVREILRTTMARFDMSARAYDRIIKVARTIADLEASPEILPHHMHEAVGYRTLDRASWGATNPSKLPF